MSVWFQINRKMVNTIRFRYHLIRFRKVFSVCRMAKYDWEGSVSRDNVGPMKGSPWTSRWDSAVIVLMISGVSWIWPPMMPSGKIVEKMSVLFFQPGVHIPTQRVEIFLRRGANIHAGKSHFIEPESDCICHAKIDLRKENEKRVKRHVWNCFFKYIFIWANLHAVEKFTCETRCSIACFGWTRISLNYDPMWFGGFFLFLLRWEKERAVLGEMDFWCLTNWNFFPFCKAIFKSFKKESTFLYTWKEGCPESFNNFNDLYFCLIYFCCRMKKIISKEAEIYLFHSTTKIN